MPKRVVNFTDLGMDPDDFSEEDKPTGSLHQSVGQIFREHQDLLTKAEWRVAESRYCLDRGIGATARALRISREKCRELTKSAFEKLMREAKRAGKKESR